jgi:hypothetical protein
MEDYVHDIHDHAKQTINGNNVKYKFLVDTHRRRVVFEVDDLVWAILTHDRLPMGEYNKLKERKIDPCEVL